MKNMRILAGRLAAASLAVILAAAMLLPSGRAAGYTGTNGYVLNFGGHTDQVHLYAQFSPYVPTLTYDGDPIDGYSIVFGLYDEYNQLAFENLYCTDLPVDTEENINYRPLNLSDSTYAAALADKLRAIVLHTYPYLQVEKVAAASGIEGLTLAETITASQLAIWKTAHGDNVQITDFLDFTTSGNQRDSDIQRKLNAERTAYNDGTDEYRAAVKSRIEALYNYLMTLPEQRAIKSVVSEAAFVSKSVKPTVTANGDGTCNVTVHTTVNVQMTGDDSLTLTAHMADGAYSVSGELVNGSNSCTLTIENVPAEYADGTVTLAIDGVQTLNDVYLVDAKGIRGASQSMIGALNITLPVHAETWAEPDRVLNICKTAGGRPLAGISFDVYWVGSLEEYLNGTLGIGVKPTQTDIARYAKYTNLVGTLTTDADGCASLDLGAGEESDGVYLVKELSDDRVTEAVAPFFVVLPDYSRCDETGAPAYTITASPKNTLHTGRFQLVKQDADTGKPLAGAVFEVYRMASQSEIAADTGNELPQFTVGETTYKMVRVGFYDNAEMTGEQVTSLTTDTDGQGWIFGLAYGDYYLVEIQAPAGYNKLPQPIRFTVDAASGQAGKALTVENTSGTVLPSTGGMGTTIFTVAGSLLMAGAAAVILRRRTIC